MKYIRAHVTLEEALQLVEDQGTLLAKLNTGNLFIKRKLAPAYLNNNTIQLLMETR